MADYTVSNDVDALMRSADNAAIKTQLDIFTPEAIMNPVVEGMGLLNAFKGSSAAYSLRDLNGDDPNVVDVRRASDDTTATFKASEMGSVVENWVNATVALPLDTASGASAAYSLRDLAATRSDITVTDDTGHNRFTINGLTGALVGRNGTVMEQTGLQNGGIHYTAINDSDFTIYRESTGTWRLWDLGVYATSSTTVGSHPWDVTWAGEVTSATFDNRNSTGKVVAQVRRSSDDEIKSFTAADVAGTALTDWVNTDVQLTLPIARQSTNHLYETFSSATTTGFYAKNTSNWGLAGFEVSGSAGESLSITFDVTLVSGTPYVSLKASPSETTNSSSSVEILTSGTHTVELNATSDFGFVGFGSGHNELLEFTISNVTITQTKASGHVVTWYDQSGNANHATQATPASQPKIVDGGTLVADGLKFDGVDDALDYIGTGTTPNASIFGAMTRGTSTSDVSRPIGFRDATGGSNKQSFSQAQDGTLRFDGAASSTGTQAIPASGAYLRSSFKTLTTAKDFINGNSSIDETGLTLAESVNHYAIGIAHGAGTAGFNGSISEVIIYNSDQSLKRTAIESNMADHYGDIELPAGFDSGNNEVDGFVAQWYDQGGVNHAVQGTTTSQPKLVENGTYLGEVKFDGVNDYLELSNVFTGTGGVSTFVAGNADSTGINESIFNQGSINGASGSAYNLTSEIALRVAGSTTFDNDFVSANTLLLSMITPDAGTSADAVCRLNGTQLAQTGTTSTTLNYTNQTARIGGNVAVSAKFDGSINEIIIYDSDQSAARTNIEYNINNAYSIY